MKLADIIRKKDAVAFYEYMKTQSLHVNGYNVLHETIARGSHDLAKVALDMHPELMYGGDYPYVNTPLMYAILSHDMDMIRLFDQFPDAYKISNEHEETPLSTAIKTKNLDVIHHVYRMYPEALHRPNAKGQYPLHIACQHGCSRDIIEQIYTTEQDVADSYGNYPLHLYGALTSDDYHVHGNHEGVVAFFAQQNNNVLHAKNNSRNTPLHNLAMLDAPKQSILHRDIRGLLSPETIRAKNNQQMTPIDIASFYHDIPLTIAMMTVCPDIIYTSNAFEYLSTASSKDVCRIASHALSLDEPVRESLWDFIPRPLQYFHQFLHKIRPEHLENAMSHITKKARATIRSRIMDLTVAVIRNDTRIDSSILRRIVLLSMM